MKIKTFIQFVVDKFCKTGCKILKIMSSDETVDYIVKNAPLLIMAAVK